MRRHALARRAAAVSCGHGLRPAARGRVRADPERPLPRDRWPATIPAVAQLLREGLTLPAGVTFLVGENGSGKSTIVEAVAMAYGLGRRGWVDRQPARHARARSRRCRTSAPAARVWGPGVGGSSCAPRRCTASTPTSSRTRAERDPRFHEMSHGESFLEVIGTPLRLPRLLLPRRAGGSAVVHLDPEPDEHAARPGRRGGQVLCATHSPVLAALPGAPCSRSATGGCVRPPGRTSSWSGTGGASSSTPEAYTAPPHRLSPDVAGFRRGAGGPGTSRRCRGGAARAGPCPGAVRHSRARRRAGRPRR